MQMARLIDSAHEIDWISASLPLFSPARPGISMAGFQELKPYCVVIKAVSNSRRSPPTRFVRKVTPPAVQLPTDTHDSESREERPDLPCSAEAPGISTAWCQVVSFSSETANASLTPDLLT